jgi:hypothetical protein
MKYIAPVVLNRVAATTLIQGTKELGQVDSKDPINQSNGAAYGADE